MTIGLYKKGLVLAIICLFIGAGIVPQIVPKINMTVKADPGDVVLSFNSPEGDTRGLAWDGQYLWNANAHTSKIYKLNPTNGNIIESIISPSSSPLGLTWDGINIWNSDRIFDKIYKLNPLNGNILHSFNSPGPGTVGLAWDGTYLWNIDSLDNKIYKINPEDGSIVEGLNIRYRETQGDGPSGLTWDGESLWISDSNTDRIYKINIADGSILYSINCPGESAKGLTWDGNYLWCSDSSDDKIYKIDVHGSETRPPSVPIITGPASGMIKTSYDYTFNSTDSDGDDITYLIDWGDGDTDAVSGASNEKVTLKHTWSSQGNYIIKAKAKDVHGAESDWATLDVSMPKNRIINPFERFLESHPHMFPLLRQLLGLQRLH